MKPPILPMLALLSLAAGGALAAAPAYVAQAIADPSRPKAEVAVLGDFNVAPGDRDFWDLSALEGMTHVSPPERAAIAALEELGYEDVFRRFHPEGGVFSWWDYRDGAFHKGHGMRIDLVLTSALLSSRVTGAFVDRDARKGVKPSDHAPVVVDLD